MKTRKKHTKTKKCKKMKRKSKKGGTQPYNSQTQPLNINDPNSESPLFSLLYEKYPVICSEHWKITSRSECARILPIILDALRDKYKINNSLQKDFDKIEEIIGIIKELKLIGKHYLLKFSSPMHYWVLEIYKGTLRVISLWSGQHGIEEFAGTPCGRVKIDIDIGIGIESEEAFYDNLRKLASQNKYKISEANNAIFGVDLKYNPIKVGFPIKGCPEVCLCDGEWLFTAQLKLTEMYELEENGLEEPKTKRSKR